jgi:AcrR family transcriptional regulator
MQKGDRTREAILDRALADASVVGLEGLSIGKLATELALSKSGLFAHFGSKEELQYQVLARAVERFVDVVVTPALAMPRGEARLRGLLDNWLRWARDRSMPGGCLILAATIEFDDRPGRVRDYLVASQKQWLAALAKAVRLGIEEGQFKPTTDAEQAAHEVYAIALGYNHAARLLADPQAELRARRSFDALIDRLRRPPATHAAAAP